MRGHDVLASVSRPERRRLLALEAERRKTGGWPEWETITFPRGSAGPIGGWAGEFTTCHRNWVFSVLDRPVAGGFRHLGISSLSEIRPTWPEAQRIKNELAGADATAVEVYPPDAEVIDQAHMYHLWVLPSALPFSLHPRPAFESSRPPVPGPAASSPTICGEWVAGRRPYSEAS